LGGAFRSLPNIVVKDPFLKGGGLLEEDELDQHDFSFFSRKKQGTWD
jgi:hypothetical protein